jgi:lipopolysaccharide transport system permease protein
MPLASPMVLRASRGWQLVDFSDLWQYRELLWFLALRDVKVRYKQAVLGFAWAVLQPFAAMVVMSVFFGKLAGMDQHTDAYPVFLYAGLLPWTFFAAAVTASSVSLVNNAGMVQKIYFPRLIVPLAAVGAPVVDFGAAFTVLIGLMLYFGVAASWQLLWLPVLLASVIVAALAVGILLSALTVAYRDFRYIVPFIVQLGLLGTPAIYGDTSRLPEQYQWLVSINPLNALIGAFRGAILGEPIDFVRWGVSAAAMAVLLVAGLMYFKQTERQFADIV